MNNSLLTVQAAYLLLLSLPHGTDPRIRLQPTLAALRDEIALATGRDAEDVQDEHEHMSRMSLRERIEWLCAAPDKESDNG